MGWRKIKSVAERDERSAHIYGREKRMARYYFQLNESRFRRAAVGKERFARQERPITHYLHTRYLAVHITEIYIRGVSANERLMKFDASINQ